MKKTAVTRILIVASNFAPEMTGIGKYVGEMAQWLGSRDFEVRVVTAPPYYPAWRIEPGHSGARYRREVIDGTVVYRCPLYVPEKPSGLKRILHLLSFGLSSLPACLWLAVTWRPQLVFVVEPPLAAAPGAWLAARLARGKAWLHVQDYEIDAAFQLGLLRSPRLRRIATGFEAWLMARFDRVSTISRGMLDRLGERGIPPTRRVLFPNWVDTQKIRPENTGGTLRSELGLPADTRIVLYSGNLGRKQWLEGVIEAAGLLSARKDLMFVICGDGGERPKLQALAHGMANVRFLPLQPAERLNELLNLADVHVLPQRPDVEDLVMPSKLSAMMASARPVVATAAPDTELGRVVSEGGVVVPPGDVVAFAAAISLLVDDPEARRELGESGRQFAVGAWERDAIFDGAFSRPSLAEL